MAGLPQLGASTRQASFARQGSFARTGSGLRQGSFKDEDKPSASLISLRRQASEKKQQEDNPTFKRFQEEMKIRVRSGDQAGLFRRGLEGWVKDGLQLRDYAREKDVRVNSYVPITAADLKASGTKDWESASKVVHGKRSDDKEAGGREIIPFMDLSVKQLTHTPLELTKKPSIISLHLGYNQLANLNIRFFLMPMLRELNLDQNELKDLPAEWQYLTSLEILSLKNNQIETISHKFCVLTNLRELSLSYNSIKKLPPFWGRLCKLRALWVSGNSLESLPCDETVKTNDYDPKTGEVLRQFSKGIGGLTSLEELWVDCNMIPSIPKEIAACQTLKYLNCRRNRITSLPAELGQLQNLEYLVASHNLVQAIPPELCKLPKLHTLELEGNLIPELPDYIMDATSLSVLDLSNNPLRKIPSVVSLMPHLLTLRTSNVTKNASGICLTAGWSKSHTLSKAFPRITHSLLDDGRPGPLTVDKSSFRPSTSCSRLYPEHERANPHGPAGPPPSRRGMRFAPVEVWNGDSEMRPMTVITPGGRIPSSTRTTYSAPPASIRPPSTPFSSSRPNTSGWSSGASAHNAA